MNGSGTTLVQTWSRNLLLVFLGSVLIFHGVAFLVAIFVAPSLYHSAHYRESTCKEIGDLMHNSDPSWSSACVPLEKGEKVALESVVTNFRFPRNEDSVSKLKNDIKLLF